VVPFGLPADPPRRTAPAIRGVWPGIGPDDEILLWGGGIYDWFDPLVLIRAVDRLRQRRPQVRLYFLGLRHPNPEVPEMRMATAAVALADELNLTDRHVFFNHGWVGYEERQNFLLDADVGVSTHLEHAETAFSFRTRIVDYLWAGLPIVTTAGDGFADLVGTEGLGLVVAPGDVDGLAEALWRLLDDTALRDRCRANVQLVRGRYVWSTALQPLVEFCRHPRRAPDRVTVPMVQVEVAASQPGWRQDLRIVSALYRDGGARRVGQGVSQRLRRQWAPNSADRIAPAEREPLRGALSRTRRGRGIRPR
ncbi:MAG: glycosyltransferase family 4 protein, partial [Pseudonocardiaceae bacterium]